MAAGLTLGTGALIAAENTDASSGASGRRRCGAMLRGSTMTYDKVVRFASLLAAVGCGGSGGMSGGGEPTPFIQIQSPIPDGTTAAGQGPFPVTFYGAGRMLDAATLADLVGRLRITTWPEGAAVPVTTTVDPPTTGGNTATAKVSAAETLTARWYALGFGPQANGITTQQTFDSNVWGVRLRPDSHPTVRLVEFCATGANGGMKFIVAFSEPVTVDSPTDALSVQQSGAAVTCRLDGVGSTDVHQFCEALMAGPATVSLAARTVRGPDAAFLATQTWPVNIAQLPIVESECHGYRVPLGD